MRISLVALEKIYYIYMFSVALTRLLEDRRP